MDAQVLLIAFIIFILITMIVVLIFRRMTVDDIFSDESPSFAASGTSFDNRLKKTATRPATQSFQPASTSIQTKQQPSFELNRQNLNKWGKILGAVGAVMIVLPLPSALDGLSFGIAFVGYIMARFTTPIREKPKGMVQASAVTNLRQLASKPEYREALPLLTADMADKNLSSDAERQQRAIRYLQSKGVPEQEAAKNVALLAQFISQQNKK